MLTARQETVLKLIVDDYVRTATPLASEGITKNHDLGVSPATIRNDVADLEESGYITRPHPSAGSVPSDKAYRFYVESVVSQEVARIPPHVQGTIRRQLGDAEHAVEQWVNVAATVLASLAGNMAVATFPKATESRMKHLELVQIQDFLALLIVVLERARLRRHLIRLSEPVDASELETSANRVKSHLQGLTHRQIDSHAFVDGSPLEEKLVEATALILREEDRSTYREHYVDGLSNLLNQPEFAENERVRDIVEGVENRSLVDAVLEETPDGGVVRVIIGQENRGDVLWPLSIVICQYGIPYEAFGSVGVVGPTRMEYPKTIAGVKLLSTVMSELVTGVGGG